MTLKDKAIQLAKEKFNLKSGLDFEYQESEEQAKKLEKERVAVYIEDIKEIEQLSRKR